MPEVKMINLAVVEEHCPTHGREFLFADADNDGRVLAHLMLPPRHVMEPDDPPGWVARIQFRADEEPYFWATALEDPYRAVSAVIGFIRGKHYTEQSWLITTVN